MDERYRYITPEEFDGKRGRIVYASGTVVYGDFQVGKAHATICIDKNTKDTVLYRCGDGFRVYNDAIRSIELVDDEASIFSYPDANYIRIVDPKQTVRGDVFIGTDGQHFTISSVDLKSWSTTCTVRVGDGFAQLPDVYFDYALRDKNRLPTIPGLYGDTGNSDRIWRFGGCYWELLSTPITDKAYRALYKDKEVVSMLNGATMFGIHVERDE